MDDRSSDDDDDSMSSDSSVFSYDSGSSSSAGEREEEEEEGGEGEEESEPARTSLVRSARSSFSDDKRLDGILRSSAKEATAPKLIEVDIGPRLPAFGELLLAKPPRSHLRQVLNTLLFFPGSLFICATPQLVLAQRA